MASFGSATFKERITESWSAGEGDQAVAYTVHHIPGSNDNVINSTGKLTRTLDILFSCSSSEYSALVSALDSSATLTYHGGTATAYFAAIAGAQKHTYLSRWRGTLRFVV